MLIWVSVMTSELPASLAVIVRTSQQLLQVRSTGCVDEFDGMIWVTISSLFGMAAGSLPALTGMSRVLAFPCR